MITRAQLEADRYKAYLYSYPHKTSYRSLSPRPLSEVWSKEGSVRFLYAHIPFCSNRCGFCNLFTSANDDARVDAYLDAMAREMTSTSEMIGKSEFAKCAIGGGTPTLLNAHQLDRLFALLQKEMNVQLHEIPCSIETSPTTTDITRLAVLENYGVSRISIGIQSFLPEETRMIGRTQTPKLAEKALDLIRFATTASLNIDLIYGIPGQTPTSFIYSLNEALKWDPEEFFLYPLYVRSGTGVAKRQLRADRCAELYKIGRSFLLEKGYEQVTMRHFQKVSATSLQTKYRCQEDNMVGLGCGARSYTSNLHYSREWSVKRKEIRDIVKHYIESTHSTFRFVRHGFELNLDEKRRRWLILSLLDQKGVDHIAYQNRFNESISSRFPMLAYLVKEKLAEHTNHYTFLLPAGIALSDSIGAALISPAVQEKMTSFTT